MRMNLVTSVLKPKQNLQSHSLAPIIIFMKIQKYNKNYSNPNFVKSIHEKIVNQDEQKCILMPSGSSYSKKNGFKLIDHNYKI